MAPTKKTVESELDKAKEQFDNFDNQVKELTMDRMNAAPKQESEGPRLSQNEIANSKDLYLKPDRSLGVGVHPKTGEKEKFNEKFREDWEFAKQYVQFVAQNNEIIGEDIEIWTKPFPGVQCERWKVPVNKPVWGPRYLAEQIKRKSYHRLKMDQSVVTGVNSAGTMYGAIAVDTTIQRLDAHPVSNRKSVFMGASGF